MNKIILTLTTIPERLNSTHNYDMRYCIESLLSLNYSDYEVHLNIPNIYGRTGEQYLIPEWLECITDEKLKIYRTDDYGSITKLIPTLKRIDDENAIIIVVDDDVTYHKELINEHLKNRKQWPDYAVGYDGIRTRNTDGTFASNFGDPRDYFFTATGTNSLVDILQHYKSISYNRYFFEDDFYAFIEENGMWCDDTCVSAYFAMKGRGRLATYFEKDQTFEDYNEHLNNLRHTFPIIRHVEHDQAEGCNLDRAANNKEAEILINKLYVNYIDNSYTGKEWHI